MKNIKNIHNNWLCTGCGTCAGICPTSAIKMIIDHKGVYAPYVDESLCIDCGLCLKVCPGHLVDFMNINSYVFSKLPTHPEIGNFKNTYVAYSTNDNIRKAGQSGGVVSALLIYALENDIIDGAVVTKMSLDNPLRPETFIARSKEDVLDASGSKYCPVPANEILSELVKLDGRFAFVGIPCQIHGLRKVEQLFPNLREKIILHIGIFCDRTLNFHFQDYILRSIGRGKRGLIDFIYRSKEWRGWPGDIKIKFKDGEERNISRHYRINAKIFFTPWRCNLCFDKLNELADLSIGDAWLPEYASCDKGISMIITRTKIADDFIKKLNAKGVLKLIQITPDKVIMAQKPQLKKILLNNYFRIQRASGKNLPKYSVSFIANLGVVSRILTLLVTFIDYLIYRLSCLKVIRKLILSCPMLLPFQVISVVRNGLIEYLYSKVEVARFSRSSTRSR